MASPFDSSAEEVMALNALKAFFKRIHYLQLFVAVVWLVGMGAGFASSPVGWAFAGAALVGEFLLFLIWRGLVSIRNENDRSVGIIVGKLALKDARILAIDADKLEYAERLQKIRCIADWIEQGRYVEAINLLRVEKDRHIAIAMIAMLHDSHPGDDFPVEAIVHTITKVKSELQID